MLRSRDGKYAGKKIFDGSSFYAHASFTKWRTGAKELTEEFLEQVGIHQGSVLSPLLL